MARPALRAGARALSCTASRQGLPPCSWNVNGSQTEGWLSHGDRYKLLETANFPWRSWESLIATCQLMTSIALFVYGAVVPNARTPIAAYTLLAGSIFMFVTSTFIATAPIIGRITFIRRAYLIVNHYVLFRFMESIQWCTGVPAPPPHRPIPSGAAGSRPV